MTDLGSSNGTYLNGILLAANVPYRVSEGDLLQFGVDDEESLIGTSSLAQKDRLVILQVKWAPAKPSPLEWPESKRSFSPSRILQEARNILSRSSKGDLPLERRSMASFVAPPQFSRAEECMRVQDLSSKLVALAQKLVETAEAAKAADVPQTAALSDLSDNVEAALEQHGAAAWGPSEAATTIHSRPTLRACQRIIVSRPALRLTDPFGRGRTRRCFACWPWPFVCYFLHFNKTSCSADKGPRR